MSNSISVSISDGSTNSSSIDSHCEANLHLENLLDRDALNCLLALDEIERNFEAMFSDLVVTAEANG